MLIQKTYIFYNYDPRFFELAKEAGEVYSRSLEEFWKEYNENKNWLSKFELQEHMKDKIKRNILHSHSFLGAMQQVHANLKSWREAKKVNPTTAKPPSKKKFLQAIVLKQSQIKFENGKLKLSITNGSNGYDKYLYLNWNPKIPIPVYATITYSKIRGWKINLVIEQEEKENLFLNPNKSLSIDLGVKRIATFFDGEKSIILSGKKYLALMHYRNKYDAKNKSKIAHKKNVGLQQQKDKLKKELELKQKENGETNKEIKINITYKESNNYKKAKRSSRKRVDKIQNIQQDMLHKQSRFIINYAIHNNIGNIIIGNNSSTHDGPNLGKKNNQKISQNPEQKLKNYIKYKFESISGKVNIVPEPYTSQTCPCCGTRKKQTNRRYICENANCLFVYDRDGVGAINIYQENVSSSQILSEGRIRSLTEPIGRKFKNKFSFKSYVVG